MALDLAESAPPAPKGAAACVRPCRAVTTSAASAWLRTAIRVAGQEGAENLATKQQTDCAQKHVPGYCGAAQRISVAAPSAEGMK